MVHAAGPLAALEVGEQQDVEELGAWRGRAVIQ
jgi:hypothetical protein